MLEESSIPPEKIEDHEMDSYIGHLSARVRIFTSQEQPSWESTSIMADFTQIKLNREQLRFLDEQRELFAEQKRLSEIQESATIWMKRSTIWIAIMTGIQVAIMVINAFK